MLIQSQRDFDNLCTQLSGHPTVFIDTEFVGDRRYYPLLCTIQLGTFDAAWIVDTLAVRNLQPLAPLLAAPETLKVFHAAGQDLQILFREFGQPVAPVFDSQIAAQLLIGAEQISFAQLVQQVTGQQPAKGHSFTQWDRRPLTDGQIEYALDDVRLLAPVYAAQRDQLAERGRDAWAREEFARLEDAERYQERDPAEQYRRVKGYNRLRGPALAALQALAAWREETARDRDKPVPHIVRDEVLVEVARHPLKSVNDLRDIRGLHQDLQRRYGEELIAVAAAGREQKPPKGESRPPLDNALEPTVDYLVLCLRMLSRDLDLSPTSVATRGDLIELVRQGEDADVPVLQGWRREAVGERLLDTMNGRATVRVLPDSRIVELEWKDGATHRAG